MKHSIAWAFLATLSSALSCAGGTDTGNPATVRDFTSSGCKNEQADAGRQALSIASDVDGLQCVEWTRVGSGLQLRLLNFPEGCADKYSGTAALTRSGELELAVYTDTCAVAACGSCVFDFEYELTGVPHDQPLALRIGHAVCESEPTIFTEQLTLPIDERASGIVCRYMDAGALTWYASARGTCGMRNMPCGNCDDDLTSCESGLACTPLATNDARCLVSCEGDDDCKAGLASCRDGVCRANATW